ncbi:MAG TPA: alpha/beta hydrolase [Thermoanaerobaculia bacterium]|nr:alpha/beta hydrolase [Thermoanaerobaculia bacterium]
MKLKSLVLSIVIALLAWPSFGGPLRQRFAARRAALEDDVAGTPRIPANVRVLHDVAYGTDSAQRLDVYIPANAKDATVIFMVHGGGWKRGDKAMKGVVEQKVAHWSAQGAIFVSANYRMLPTDVFTQADDVARAIAFAQKNAAAWGGDREKFVLMGHSAGAHLVALLTSASELASRHDVQRWLATVLLDSAALDVPAIMERRHFDLYDEPFGDDPKFWRAVSPMHQLTKATAPVLVVCSSRRNDSTTQARAYAAKATALGMTAVVLPVDLSHGEINKELGAPSRYTNDVDAFLRKAGVR